jgi:hypothetical protein
MSKLDIEQRQALKTEVAKSKYDEKSPEEIADMLNDVNGGETTDSVNVACSVFTSAILLADVEQLSQSQRDWLIMLASSGDGLVSITDPDVKDGLLELFKLKPTEAKMIALMSRPVSVAEKNNWPKIKYWHVAREMEGQ